jgi:ferric-dicitrate binding protein FerR (iron transport regulator)
MSRSSSGASEFREPSAVVRSAAREWVIRADRGLTPEEKAEFHRWLAADLVHTIAWEENLNLFEHMDRLTASRAVSGHPRPAPRWRRWAPLLASAALVTIALGVALRPKAATTPAIDPVADRGPVATGKGAAPGVAPAASAMMASTGAPGTEVISQPPRGPGGSPSGGLAPAGGQVRRLSDGTLVFLKPGAEFYERFSAGYRAVNLVQGEAMFDVAAGGDERLFVLTAGTFGTDGAVAVTTRDSWFSVAVEGGVVETKVLTGQTKVVPAQAVVLASRSGTEPRGMVTDAGLTTKIDYPSTADSEPHLSVLAPAELAELMAWKRSIEVSVLPVSLGPR